MADPGETAWLDELQVRITVGDTRMAQPALTQAAGVTFACAPSGAHSADFALALAEQELLVERAIVKAGHRPEPALLAAEHFAVAAHGEWGRITRSSSGTAWEAA